MRVPTLKSYIKEQFLKENENSLSFAKALETSKKRKSLATYAQAFFLSLGEQEKADAFASFTKVELTVEEFSTSSQKLVVEFEKIKMQELLAKIKLRDFIAKEMKTKNLTFYKIAKLLQTSQSNVDCFFKKEEMNKLSIDQLKKLKTLI